MWESEASVAPAELGPLPIPTRNVSEGPAKLSLAYVPGWVTQIRRSPNRLCTDRRAP